MYALLYGAGDRKLGLIVLSYYAALGLKPPSNDPRKLGKAFRERLYKGLGIGLLMKGISTALENRDWLKGIDGRAVPVRSHHSALNTLLQSAGSIAFKTRDRSLSPRSIHLWLRRPGGLDARRSTPTTKSRPSHARRSPKMSDNALSCRSAEPASSLGSSVRSMGSSRSEGAGEKTH